MNEVVSKLEAMYEPLLSEEAIKTPKLWKAAKQKHSDNSHTGGETSKKSAHRTAHHTHTKESHSAIGSATSKKAEGAGKQHSELRKGVELG